MKYICGIKYQGSRPTSSIDRAGWCYRMTPYIATNPSMANPFENDDEDATVANQVSDVNEVVPNSINTSKYYEDNTLSPEQRRIQRIREESLRRLTAAVSQVQTVDGLVLNAEDINIHGEVSKDLLDQPIIAPLDLDEMILPSTIAAAIELGVDKELFSELQNKMKQSSANISKICSEHSDAFLASVGRVGSLGSASEEIRSIIVQVYEYYAFLCALFSKFHSTYCSLGVFVKANDELQQGTGGQLSSAAIQLDYARNAEVRARTLYSLLNTCRKVAALIERGRKQASLNRPKAALDAVQEAQLYLSAPLGSIMIAPGGMALLTAERDTFIDAINSDSSSAENNTSSNDPGKGPQNAKANDSGANFTTPGNRFDRVRVATNPVITLDQTSFGLYARQLLPKIENDILQAARKGLSKWFLSIRSNGDGLKVGRSVLRRCATSLAVGTGQVGQGGKSLSYYWRAKTADNLIARASQSLRLSRAIRMGYWIDRDCKMESEIIESTCPMGIERGAEALACAFGWYRCWTNITVSDVEVTKSMFDSTAESTNRTQSVMGQASRHGSLPFRSPSISRVGGSKDLSISKSRGLESGVNRLWASVLVPNFFSEDKATRDEDDNKFATLAESLHPVHLAESAYARAGKSDEFRVYYEQNRFGDVKILEGKKGDDGLEKETRSPLSSLSGDDVTQGTDRVFFANNFPRFCSHIIGFSATEAALELGKLHLLNNVETTDSNDMNQVVDVGEQTFLNATYSFREQSARYERNLINELGNIYRSRAIGATLAELARAATLMSVFRSSLGSVHPGSMTRKLDKELLRVDVDMLMTALKACQDEQLKETIRLSKEDNREPMRVPINESQLRMKDLSSNIPAEEVMNFPFGLSSLIISQDTGKENEKIEKHSGIQGSRHAQAPQSITYTFSQSVPKIVRLIHSRVITFTAFALSQDALGSIPSHNNVPGIAVFVMDCLEECVKVAAIGMKEGSDSALYELSITTMIQISVNLSALQSCLPRLFGTITRGLCHIGVVQAENVNAAFEYADSSLQKAYKACDNEVGGLYSLVSESLRNKIDAMLKFALDKFQWVSKAARTIPNTYCDGLIEYLKSTFRFLSAMDEGSSAGLHFSCLGHIADRLSYLLAASSDSTIPTTDDGEFLPTISKIDSYGIKNLLLDVREFQIFADNTKVPQLSECFNELKSLLEALLDPELPQLLQLQNEHTRKTKYPLLSLEKLLNVLDKYQVTTMLDKLMTTTDSEILLLEKKDVLGLMKLIKSQLDKK